MANRKVYRVGDNKEYVKEIEVNFKWYAGFSVSQKQKSIVDLHNEYNKIYKLDKVLEVSTKSLEKLGISLSAFNLMINAKDNKIFSVESAFQSSKKFELGGPYIDILDLPAIEAKKDMRLKNSGKLIGFEFYGRRWPLEPKTVFYDWLYVRALYKNQKLSKEILKYDAFTDIEFNPKKSLNCQAKSAALFVALSRANLLDYSMKSIENYFEVILNARIDRVNKQMDFFE